MREQEADFTASLSERTAESHISFTLAGVSAQLRRASQQTRRLFRVRSIVVELCELLNSVDLKTLVGLLLA